LGLVLWFVFSGWEIYRLRSWADDEVMISEIWGSLQLAELGLTTPWQQHLQTGLFHPAIENMA